MYRLFIAGCCAVALIGCSGSSGSVQKGAVSTTLGEGIELVVLNLPGMT
ncbi:MAG: hypothetical protein JNJ77_20665 [Planctomycetia bacterium]|nr:hypothetical protein [Planctomycetia bacterium]